MGPAISPTRVPVSSTTRIRSMRSVISAISLRRVRSSSMMSSLSTLTVIRFSPEAFWNARLACPARRMDRRG